MGFNKNSPDLRRLHKIAFEKLASYQRIIPTGRFVDSSQYHPEYAVRQLLGMPSLLKNLHIISKKLDYPDYLERSVKDFNLKFPQLKHLSPDVIGKHLPRM